MTLLYLLLLPLLVPLLVCPGLVQAVYEDQHQEYDWQLTNIGDGVENVIYKSKYALVSTSEGVLAAINLKSGKLLWRIVFEQNTRVIEMVSSDTVTFTLSQRLNIRTQTSTSIVQAWDALSGELLWDVASADGLPSDVNIPSSLLFDEKQHHLHVLDNTISEQSFFSVLETQKGSALVQLVSTELVEFLPAEWLEQLPSGDEDMQLVFLQLMHLTQDDVAGRHVLSGCISIPTEEMLSSIGCQYTFVLDLKLGGLKKEGRAAPMPKLHIFAGFSYISDYRQVVSHISSSSGFDADDAIISVASPDSGGGDTHVTAVFLSDHHGKNSIRKLTMPQGGSFVVPKIFVNKNSAERNVVLSSCSSSGCSAGMVDFNDDSSLSFRSLLSCEGSSSVIGYENLSSESHVTSAVSCFSVSKFSSEVVAPDGCPSSDDALVKLTSCSIFDVTESDCVASSFENSPSPPAKSIVTKLRDAFVYHYRVKASGEARLKALVVSSTGSLHFFQKRGEDTNNMMQWCREEALAKVVDSVIVDGDVSDPVKHKRVEKLGGEIPTLETRLRMQLVDLQDFFFGYFTKLKSDIELLVEGRQISTAANRPTLEAFGFNKVSVMFTSICHVDTSSFSPSTTDFGMNEDSDMMMHCLEGFKVYGLDLITGNVIWAFEPLVLPYVPSKMLKNFEIFGRLLNVRPHVHGSRVPEMVLLLSLGDDKSGDSILLTFSFNPQTGDMISNNMCQTSNANSMWRHPTSVRLGLGHVTSVQLYNGDVQGQVESNSFLLIHQFPTDSNKSPLVSLFPHNKNVLNVKPRDVYAQVCSHKPSVHCGSLVSYRVDFDVSNPSPGVSAEDPCLYAMNPVGSVVFTKEITEGNHLYGESVVAVEYPTVGDPIHSRAKVLGDNSLLLKYLNPHVVVVVTEKIQRDKDLSSKLENFAPIAEENGDIAGGISLAGDNTMQDETPPAPSPIDDDDDHVDELFVNVIDTVSSQIVYRYSILHASTKQSGRSSVQICLIENNLLVSYWSNQAQRQELSSVSLFEGMLDKYALSPFSSIKVDQIRSSFNSPSPIALQKTFILPRKITSMHHSVTSRGISNKNLILGLGSGQVYSVDLRMLDPRRPVNKPSPAEIEEKLMQYIPFIPIHPFQMLSTNSTLPPVERILSSPSKLESTSVIVALGLDIYHTRTVPSKGFDMLASDFNKPLLSLILISMCVVVVWLRTAYKKQLLSAGWK